ncbi:NACHT domain-containing protein [Kribbella sp. NPDC051936]|uniref:NACHT domain-containing protein n=1 Tax=Kribbella sp. NPDC051936 TaxID=3154946 RepID=UPI003439E492
MQLLGDTGDPRPADLGFNQPDATFVRWRNDGGGESGSLSTIADYYQSLQRGRLVVLGEAGAGKTVLVLRMLLDLAAERPSSGTVDHCRTPVRLSLASFTTTASAVTEVRAEFDRWIADQLVEVHGVRPTTANALVAGGWVLPILDGLDEMDPDDGVNVRARQLLAALNLPVGSSPATVVLTCRTERYRCLAADGCALEDATAVAVQPLECGQILGWLEHRLPQPDQRDRWRSVFAVLRKHPNGRLARCLSSPLRLFLALTIYEDGNTRPKALCELDEAELDRHLIDRYVPAVVRHHPRQDGSHYEAAQVEQWLRTLALLLVRSSGSGASATDITPDGMWRFDGDPPGRRIRFKAAALLTLVIVVLWVCGRVLDAGARTTILNSTFNVGIAVCALGCAAYLGLSKSWRIPPRVDLRQARSPQFRPTLRSALWEGTKAGPFVVVLLMFGVVFLGPEAPSGRRAILTSAVGALVVGIGAGLALGALAGLVIGLARGLTAIHESAGTPSEPHRQALTAVLLMSILGGVVVGLTEAMLATLSSALAVGLFQGVPLGFLASGAGRWYVQHRLYIRAKVKSGELPVDLLGFLDWAYRAGVLRVSGSATQFRHREVQLHFTR